MFAGMNMLRFDVYKFMQRLHYSRNEIINFFMSTSNVLDNM